MTKGRKYGNKKIKIDGMIFDSKKEGYRYRELSLLQKAGAISDLRTQVKFVLIPAQREPDRKGPKGGTIKGRLLERDVSYIADFVYRDSSGKIVVEDVKGAKVGEAYTVFVIKRKLMLYMHGIRIIEL